MGVLDYHTEDLPRREDCILSTWFDRIDPTECFFVFRLDRRTRGMTNIGGSVKADAFNRNLGQGQC